MIVMNGEVVAQASQFSLNDVEVITATIDLEEVRAYRSSISRRLQAARSTAKYHRIQTKYELSSEEDDQDTSLAPSVPFQPRYHSPEEEIALCSGAYLWDYLRRHVPLSEFLPNSYLTTLEVQVLFMLLIFNSLRRERY